MVPGPYPNPTDERESAHTLLRDLEHIDPATTPRPWGAFSSFVVGLFSLGALPALLWHDRFRDFVDDERRYLRRFADWMRLHSNRPETIDLRVAADDLGSRPLLSALSVLSVIGVVVLFAAHLGGANGFIVERVLSWTYQFKTPSQWEAPLATREKLFVAWSVGLSVAYLFHWLQVQGHASDVRRFVRHVNRGALRPNGEARVPPPRAGLGVSFLWLIAGIFLASKGAWWGIAMALSGAAQQRYMRRESLNVRRALATRVREMARLPTAGDHARVTSAGRRRCPYVGCLAAMPPGARFCPRCGHHVSPEMNSV